MTATEWNDDHYLADRLTEAIREVRTVPPGFAEAGWATFAWRDIDVELATLAYDSRLEEAAVRADVANLRALTFATSGLTIELTFMPDVLIGQVLPQCPAQIEIRTSTGTVTDVVADDLGVFTVHSPPRDPFFLSCRFGATIDVVTPLITH
jgi:hypothetical protein